MIFRSLFFSCQKTKPLLRLLLFVFLCYSTPNYAQTSQKKLEAKRTQLQREIKKVNTLLFQSKKQEKNILNEIGDLNKKIAVRKELILTIEKEGNLLDSKIRRHSKKIKALQKELVLLKKDYAEMLHKSYKNKSLQSRLMFLFSSESFLQAYKRYKYMNQYADYRKKQGIQIAKNTQKVERLNADLKVQKIQKENLLSAYETEKSVIEIEKQAQEILVKKVKSKEKQYIAQIKKKQAEERKIDREIERLIRAAIAASKKKNKAKSKGFSLTPEAKALASKFALNKGKLPWPVANALVVRNFGKIPHKTLSGITIQSNGIHIATNKGANAKAIFEGTVLAIQLGSSGIKTVMVQHGNYISLYSNLETVTVKKGDRISLNQNLGKIHTDKVTGKTLLKFQIWRDTQKQNPKSWLLRL
jgi:septal ring factor EnvC (AmiA/AmiB activator)